MAVRYLKKSVTLQGRITAEEAEELQQWLKSQPRSSVNWASATTCMPPCCRCCSP